MIIMDSLYYNSQKTQFQINHETKFFLFQRNNKKINGIIIKNLLIKEATNDKIKKTTKGEVMSKVNWTDEQKDAIYEKGSNILVAAAARKW